MTATDLVVTPDMVRAVAGLVFDTALPASIAHELNGMADQLELEQRDVAGEEGPVLSGDPDVVEAALDRLPVGSVLLSSAEAVADGESRVWVCEAALTKLGHAWMGTGLRPNRPSRYLARYCAPLTVIA